MKGKNIFWGIFFLLSGVFVVATQLGSFGEIGLLSIISTILLASLMVYSIVKLNFFGFFVPMIFLYMIYKVPLALPEVNPWLLFVAALFASIGFSIIFNPHPRKRERIHSECRQYSKINEGLDDNNPDIKVSFSSASKYLHSEGLQSGQFDVSFGELEVFFDQVKLEGNSAEIRVDCSFGSLKLYIPKDWRVNDKVHAAMGAVETDMRLNKPTDASPVLTIVGNVQLGSIEILYI